MKTKTMPALTFAEPPSRALIPDVYLMPLGTPLHWRDEVSGKLQTAVARYLNHIAYGEPAPNHEQLALLWDYVEHHINAPCWDRIDCGQMEIDVAALRATAKLRGTLENLRDYCDAAMTIALDPL